jgi:hypothetical protein
VMQFKTPQGNAAFHEVIRCTEEAILLMREQIDQLILTCPGEVVSITLHRIQREVEVRLEAAAQAVRTGAEVDVLWGGLAAHVTGDLLGNGGRHE